MHVHSLLPFLGLSLVTLAVADDSSDAPVYVHGVKVTSSDSKRSLIPRTNVRTPLDRRSASICADLPAKWSYLGCYADDPSSRALTGPSYCDDTSLAEEKCIEFCDAKGYSMAGLEFGSECYCGYSLGPSGTKASELDCSMTCTGNSDELCGAGNRMNVFTNGNPAPTVVPSVDSFTSLGCYSDSASARTLTTAMSLSGEVRVSDCTTACNNAGFSYAGLEFGDECYCGSSISNGGAPTDASSCNMACTADNTELCGGPGAINIYQSSTPTQAAGTLPAGWNSLQCYSDDVSARTLAQKLDLDPSSVTTESCISACAAAGYSIAGTEWSQECYCGNTIDNGAQPASSGCDMACSGNHGEICGGSQRINLYQTGPASCTGTPGCRNGDYGLVNQIINNVNLHQCLGYCQSTPSCINIQYGNDPGETGVCNLLSVSIASTIVDVEDPYCQTYNFYASTCGN